MKQVPLTKGYVALVDDADFERVNQFKWYAAIDRHRDGTTKNVYACRAVSVGSGKQKTVRLHRFIKGVTDPKIEVDHEDHDGLNCQRGNLRVASDAQNRHNSRKTPRLTTSRFKGVNFNKDTGKWMSRISAMGRSRYLGLHPSEESAARVYDDAAKKLFGRFAVLNFEEQREYFTV